MGTPNEQVKCKCNTCGHKFMSGALPENRRCKSQNPVPCNSADITVIETESTGDVECESCKELQQKVTDLNAANKALTIKLEAAPAEMTIKDIVFTLDPKDPFGKGLPMMIGMKTPGGEEALLKYKQRAEGSCDTDRVDAANKALAKIAGMSVVKYLEEIEKAKAKKKLNTQRK